MAPRSLIIPPIRCTINSPTGPDHVQGRRSLLDPPCPSAAMDGAVDAGDVWDLETEYEFNEGF